MAETFANAYGGDILEASSAGIFTPAKTISHTAGRLMSEKGLAMPETPPRAWRAAELDDYDLIVNLCEYGLPKTSIPVVKVGLPDPVGKPEKERREIRDEIECLVLTMLARFRQTRREWPWNISLPRSAIGNPNRPIGADTTEEARVSWWRIRPANVQSPVAGLPV